MYVRNIATQTRNKLSFALTKMIKMKKTKQKQKKNRKKAYKKTTKNKQEKNKTNERHTCDIAGGVGIATEGNRCA